MKMIDGLYELLGMPTVVRCARRHKDWPKVRKAHLAKFPACIACGDIKRHKKEIHHVVPVHFDFSKELDPNNLVTMCADPCHFVFGHLFNWKHQNPNVIEHCANIIVATTIARNEIKRLAGMGMRFGD